MLRRRLIPAIQQNRKVEMNTFVLQWNTSSPHRPNCSFLVHETVLFRVQVNFQKDMQSMACVLPDLNRSDYFFWSCLKIRVCEDNSPTIQRLKENIKRDRRIVQTCWSAY